MMDVDFSKLRGYVQIKICIKPKKKGSIFGIIENNV